MRACTRKLRVTAPITHALSLRPALVLMLALLILAALGQTASAQQSEAARLDGRPALNAEQVVCNLVQMNLHRLQALRAYHGIRTYRAEYHGFSGSRSAEMVVNVKYASPGTKQFEIVSATGSKLIIDKVFKKLLEAEQEVLDAEVERRSALTEENYRFTLVGKESTPSGETYVLKVEPRAKDKFLYRGRIWIDAEDFAVARLEAEPAKNPSFWTKKAEIVQEYRKVTDFWLPARNHSVTAIRLGGHAELTIDQAYEITGASRVSTTSMIQLPPPTETARAPE